MVITEKLRKAVKTSGQSQNRIAQAIKVSPSQLSRFMTGKRDLLGKQLDRLAEYLGISLQ